MTWLFGMIAASLGGYFLWGLLAPRNQWRVLTAWSVSNPYANEPGGASYGWRRLVSGLGVLGLAAVAVLSATPALVAALPRDTQPLSAVQTMWGAPDPQIVNRAVYGSATVPTRLVPITVDGYQNLDELDDLPTYLLGLRTFSMLGNESPGGYVGATPAQGFSGVGPADLVVQVRGPVLCIPRDAVVIETEKTVQIAIYYGLPDPTDPAAPAPDHIAGCSAKGSVTASVLIPITLAHYLGDRTVETLDGAKIHKVKVVDSP